MLALTAAPPAAPRAAPPTVFSLPFFRILAFCLICITIVVYLGARWLINPRRTKGVIVDDGRIIVFGLTPETRSIPRSAWRRLTLRSCYSAHRVAQLEYDGGTVRFPHLLLQSRAERNALAVELLQLAMLPIGDGVRIQTRPELGCFRVRPLLPRLRRAASDAEAPGTFGLGSAFRGYVPILAIYAVMIDVILRMLGAFPSPPPMFVELQRVTPKVKGLVVAALILYYLIIRLYAPVTRVLCLTTDDLRIENAFQPTKRVPWRDISRTSAHVLGPFSIFTLSRGRIDLPACNGDEARLLSQLTDRLRAAADTQGAAPLAKEPTREA